MLAMIVNYAVYSFMLLPAPNILMWLIKTLPLLLFLPAVFREQARSYQWLGFLSLLYFMDGILGIMVRVVQIQFIYSGLVTVFFSLLLYCAVIIFVRNTQNTDQKIEKEL